MEPCKDKKRQQNWKFSTWKGDIGYRIYPRNTHYIIILGVYGVDSSGAPIPRVPPFSLWFLGNWWHSTSSKVSENERWVHPTLRSPKWLKKKDCHSPYCWWFRNPPPKTSWWLNPPIWKICDRQIGSFPQIFGVKVKDIRHPPTSKMYQTLAEKWISHQPTSNLLWTTDFWSIFPVLGFGNFRNQKNTHLQEAPPKKRGFEQMSDGHFWPGRCPWEVFGKHLSSFNTSKDFQKEKMVIFQPSVGFRI